MQIIDISIIMIIFNNEQAGMETRKSVALIDWLAGTQCHMV
jgi:hypothetical protein